MNIFVCMDMVGFNIWGHYPPAFLDFNLVCCLDVPSFSFV